MLGKFFLEKGRSFFCSKKVDKIEILKFLVVIKQKMLARLNRSLA